MGKACTEAWLRTIPIDQPSLGVLVAQVLIERREGKEIEPNTFESIGEATCEPLQHNSQMPNRRSWESELNKVERTDWDSCNRHRTTRDVPLLYRVCKKC